MTVWPVTIDAPKPRKMITSAMSSGVQRRFSAAPLMEELRCSSVHSTIQVESTAPGATALTRTSGPRPRARFCVTLITPAFVAEYARLLPARPTPAMEAVLTIAPRATFSAGAAALAQRKTPSRLTCSSVSQRSSVMRSSSCGSIFRRVPGVPALEMEV
jgi:hypothetical protein